MGFKEKLLEQIISLGGKSYTIAELANRLNFRSKTERKIFSSTMRDLITEGSLIQAGKGRFTAIAKDNLIKGELRGNKRGFAFLIREDSLPDLFIPNNALNGAYNGDTVMARMTGSSEGAVVSIIKRGRGRLVGTYIISNKYGFVVPDDDNYFKDIFIPKDKSINAKPMDKVVVTFLIDKTNNKPTGEIVEVLGRAGERDAEVLSILRSYDFMEKFPENVLAASERITYKPDSKRKDLRDILTITIDGEDAKDFDDAISVEKTAKGYRLYVHIADVANYVKSGGLIDKEAHIRGTSVYFPGSVFPMLPESISNGACSLRPGEDKLAVSVIMECDKGGNVTESRFIESTIRSDYRMTYTDVTAILKGDKDLTEKYKRILPMLKDAERLAEILSRKRNNEGAINFVSREAHITLNEKGEVLDIRPYADDISNNIIEQFMVLANETVAEYISSKNLPGIFRVHEAPSETKLEGFVEFIRGIGLNADFSKGATPKIFSDLLIQIKGEPYESIVSKIMLRSMMKAKYTAKNSGHFGLSLDNYCHFTSPIRRYPDLMVHRVLKAAINNKADEKFITKYKALCEEASVKSTEREIAADKAERDIDDYYKAVYMYSKVGERYNGAVSGVLGSGIFVELPSTVEGFVSTNDLPADSYSLDEKNYRLKGNKYSFAMGDSVTVEIKSVIIETRSIDMSLIVNRENNYLRKKKKGAKI